MLFSNIWKWMLVLGSSWSSFKKKKIKLITIVHVVDKIVITQWTWVFSKLWYTLSSFRQVVYGENTIEVEVKSYWRLFIEEVFSFIFNLSKIRWFYFFIVFVHCRGILFRFFVTDRRLGLNLWSVLQVMNPFYVFQIASIILWLCDNYYYYAACILFISLVSVGISLYETKRVSMPKCGYWFCHNPIRAQLPYMYQYWYFVVQSLS